MDLNVIELRQYELHPGRRDELIELFDGKLVEPQEAVGMRVIGQFRDLDRPDRFVWLRGFADMASRTDALRAFYLGPVWAEHRDAANATMIDSDDVLLLRPAPGTKPKWQPQMKPELVEIVVRSAGQGGFDRGDGALLAELETEPAPNGFPALPVREGESVVVTVRAFDDASHHSPPADALQVLRLAGTARSRL
jgi:NIPSNAP